MWGGDQPFLYDPHIEELSIIKGVTFTPREIDIISCLLHMRGPSKIAVLLSISSNTAVSHIRNIMLKIGCNSREGIIDFIEQSPNMPLINKHYMHLALRSAFEKSLRDIAGIKRKPTRVHLFVIQGELIEKNSFIPQLKKHLNYAGIDSTIEIITNKNQEIKVSENDGSIHFLVLAKQDNVPQELLKYDLINFSQHKIYYFLVLEILKRLLHPITLESYLKNFQDQYIGMTESSTDELRLFYTQKANRKTVNKKWLLAAIPFAFMMLYYSLSFFESGQKMSLIQGQQRKELQGACVRSELPLPTSSALLERPEELTQIDESFKGKGGIRVVALVGPGGIGKTTLSRQYARQQKTKIVWEINAETTESLKASFESLARALAQTKEDKKILRGIQELKNPTEKEELLIQFVKDRLEFHSRWLLIYDNVEKFTDIQKYFPRDSEVWGEGKVILTTRDSTIQNNDHLDGFIKVKELNVEQKLILFTKIINPSSFSAKQKEEANHFLEKIPPYPLDIAVAAYYLKAVNISYAAYLENLSQHKKDLSLMQEDLLKDAGPYAKTRYGIVILSLQRLIEINKDFRDLLVYISFFDSQNLPKDLLNKHKNQALSDYLIYNLKKYSLVTEDFHFSLGQTISVHRSTQAIILDFLLGLMNKNERLAVIQSISNTMEKYTTELIDDENHSKIQAFLPHCEAFLGHRDLLNNFMKHVIHQETGIIYYFLGDYKKGKEFLESSIAVFEASKQQNHLTKSLMYLAKIYVETDDKGSMEKLIKEITKVDVNKFHGKNLTSAQLLTALGDMYDSLENHQKARELLHKSVLLHKKFGKVPLELAWTLALLGHVCNKMGHYSEARQFLEESSMVYKNAGAESNLRVGWVLIHLGNVYAALGESDKAHHLLEKGVGFYTRHFPEGHLDHAWATGYLGNSYIEIEDYEKAKNLLEKAVIVYQKNYGENHDGRLRTETYLAKVYIRLGDYSEAKRILNHVIKVYEKEKGGSPMKLATNLQLLAEVHLLENRMEAFENLIKKTIRIFEQHNHPDVSKGYENLAKIYLKKHANKMGTEEAKIFKDHSIICLKKALETGKSYFPTESPYMKRVQRELKNLECTNKALIYH